MLDKLIGAALQGLAGSRAGRGGPGGSPLMNIVMQLLLGGGQPQSGQGEGGLGGVLGGLLAGNARQGQDPLGGILGNMLEGSGGGSPLEALAGAILGGAQGQGQGGLGGLLAQLQKAGLGREADSWVSQGPNMQVSADQLARAFGRDNLQGLAQQNGMDFNELLSGLSEVLPEAVNQLTPQGKLPRANELQGILSELMKGAGSQQA